LQPGLAERLRIATATIHADAECAGIMRELVRGRLGRRAYCSLLRNLYEIYATLEAALERHTAHPFISTLELSGLGRRAALAADLHALHGERWAVELGIASAAGQYMQRLRVLDRERAELLVAHAYVRYLGDLSGGQILRRVVADSLHLAHGAGTAFYEFDGDAAVLADGFRARLDSIHADEPVVQDIVTEARSAFALHVSLFEELAAAPSRRAAPRQSPLV